MGQQKKYVLVLIGDTRTGKSSFINQHSGKKLAQVGLDNSLSTTKSIGVYPVDPYIYIDTMGFNDTNNAFSNKAIREQIVDKICALGEHEAKMVFLILESFESDTVRLNATLKNLDQLFGPTAIESTILLLTKHNIFDNEEEISVARKTIEETCKKQNLKYLNWQSNFEGYEVPAEIQSAQVSELNKLVNDVKPGSLDEIHRHRQYVETEATQRRDIFKDMESKQVTTNEEKEEAYQEPVTRYKTREIVDTIPYTEQQARTRTVQKSRLESYQEEVPIQVTEPYSYKKKVHGLAGLLGKKKWVTGYRTVTKHQTVTKQRTVPYTEVETYYVTVNKVRTNKRTIQEPYQENVTKYRKIVVPVTKIVQVEKPKPAIEYFINKVKEEEKAKILLKYGILSI